MCILPLCRHKRYRLAISWVAPLQPRATIGVKPHGFAVLPLCRLTLISAPAVLTNASCVLLFGTGNRYGRAVDRAHELAEIVLKSTGLEPDEQKLRVRQLESAQTRTLLIVRALTCFYTAVACFVGTTLLTLVGTGLGSRPILSVAFVTGCLGVLSMIAGSLMLAAESRFSFSVLRQENAFLTARINNRSI